MSGKKITLFHVSTEYQENIDLFVPRVPNSRAGDENDFMERICTSPTLEGCFLAHPSILYRMYYYVNDNDCFDPYQHMDWLSTLLDHQNATGLLLKAYEFHADKDNVLSSSILDSKGWVPDVSETDEHWIMTKQEPTHCFYVLLESIKMEKGDCVFEYRRLEENDLGNVENCLDFFRKHKAS